MLTDGPVPALQSPTYSVLGQHVASLVVVEVPEADLIERARSAR
jgi:hypothetical protein